MPIYAQNPRTSTISTIIINGKYNECKPTLPPAAAVLPSFLSHWTVFFCLAQPTLPALSLCGWLGMQGLWNADDFFK